MNKDSKTSGKKIAFISIHLSMHKLQNIYICIYIFSQLFNQTGMNKSNATVCFSHALRGLQVLQYQSVPPQPQLLL